MDIKDFQTIKDKIAKADTETATNKGKMQAIQEHWKEKYGFETLEEAEKKLAEVEKDIAEKTKLRDEKLNELENSFDWDTI